MNKKTVHVNFFIPRDLIDRVDKIAARDMITRSAVIRLAVARGLQDEKLQNEFEEVKND